MRIPPRWVRRFVGPVLLGVLALLGLGLLPLLLAAAVVASLVLPGKWRGLRLLGFALVWIAVELVALTAAFWLWVLSGFGLMLRRPWMLRLHYAVLRLVLDTVVDAAQVIFALELVTDEVSWTPLDDGVPGSTNAMLVLSRHAGPGDSLLLVHTLMNRDHLRRPRIVLKHALALDPMIDVYLHRVPAAFVGPLSHPERSVGGLARGIGDEDALLIFPEGGNFTPHRRLRAIRWLRRRGFRAHAEAADRMRHVLAPRPGGVLAALDAAPYADVVFVAHTGLDHLLTVADVWRELPQDKTLRLRWWFVPASDVPTGRDDRIAWLFERWADIDRWIEANREPAA